MSSTQTLEKKTSSSRLMQISLRMFHIGAKVVFDAYFNCLCYRPWHRIESPTNSMSTEKVSFLM